jgi:ABC-type dipeptide/oligopeptide/nickel transport system ATPase component
MFNGVNLLELNDDQMSKYRGNEIAMIFQDPLSALNPVHTIGRQIAEALLIHKEISTEAAHKRAIELLGDQSDDPSVEDLQLVIPALVETFGLDAVRLMAVQYSVSLGGFRKLVNTDERFKIPSAPVTTTRGTTGGSTVDAAAQDEKRRARAERKEKDRLDRAKAEAQRRAAYGRI